MKGDFDIGATLELELEVRPTPGFRVASLRMKLRPEPNHLRYEQAVGFSALDLNEARPPAEWFVERFLMGAFVDLLRNAGIIDQIAAKLKEAVE